MTAAVQIVRQRSCCLLAIGLVLAIASAARAPEAAPVKKPAPAKVEPARPSAGKEKNDAGLIHFGARLSMARPPKGGVLFGLGGADRFIVSLETVFTRLGGWSSTWRIGPPEPLPITTERELLRAMQTGLLRLVISEVEFRFRYIPAGNAVVGYSDAQAIDVARRSMTVGRARNARPRFETRIAEGFFILDRELTNRQFSAIEAIAQKQLDPADLDAPIRQVSWPEADQWCRRLSQRCGRLLTARLPTEIEWEYAARGWSDRIYAWPNPGEFLAWASPVLKDEKPPRPDAPRPFDANKKDVSFFHVYEMTGNVAEWCLDLYVDKREPPKGPYFPSRQEIKRPGRGTLAIRTCRGGSYRDSQWNCEIPQRRSKIEGDREPWIGFRPVLILDLKNAHSDGRAKSNAR